VGPLPLGIAAPLVGSVAISAAVIMCVLPIPAQLMLLAAVSLSVLVWPARSWWRAAAPALAIRDVSSVGANTVDAGAYRLARGLTYVGLATLGLMMLRPTAGVSASEWFFRAALVAVLLTALIQVRDIDVRLPVVIIAGVGLFAIGGLLSLPNSPDAAGSMYTLLRFVYWTVVWFLLAGFSLRTEGQVNLAMRFWVTSVALSGAAAVAQLLWGPDVIPGAAAGFAGRLTGLAPDVNALGGMCAVALVPALTLLDVPEEGLGHRLHHTLALALVCAGLLLSGSLGALAAAVVAIVVWILLGGGGRRSFATISVIVVGGILVVGQAPGLSMDRIGYALSHGDPGVSVNARFEGFDLAWQQISTSPIIGAGFDPIESVSFPGSAVHNIFIGTWFQGGLLALVGVLLLGGGAFSLGRRAWTLSSTAKMRRLSVASFAALAGAAAYAMSSPTLFEHYVWVPVFLTVALVNVQRRRQNGVQPGVRVAGLTGATPTVSLRAAQTGYARGDPR
jgi:O-antigen ligase